jgi:pyruvate,water dikinase
MALEGHIVDRLKKAIRWRQHQPAPLNDLFVRFQQILEENNTALKMIADMEDKLGGEYVFDRKFLEDAVKNIKEVVLRSAVNFNFISNNKYLEIYSVIQSLGKQLQQELAGQIVIPGGQEILSMAEITAAMKDAVGNKAYNLSRVPILQQPVRQDRRPVGSEPEQRPIAGVHIAKHTAADPGRRYPPGPAPRHSESR